MDFKEINHILTNSQPIRSLSEFIRAVNYISHTFNDNLWFRGHAKESFQILPSILRKQTWVDDYSYVDEYEIFKIFKRKCRHKKESDYEYLHLMQHFGLPTRLLDWTESSLIALFFAIENSKECENPVVWIIDPWDFNSLYHKERIIYNFFGNQIHEKVVNYINPKDGLLENMPDMPIAVIPSFYDDRVIAQKSGFILFGKNRLPLEKLVQSENYFNFAKIRIDNEFASDILIDLNIAGIDYHTIFPDMYGLVSQIKSDWNLR